MRGAPCSHTRTQTHKHTHTHTLSPSPSLSSLSLLLSLFCLQVLAALAGKGPEGTAVSPEQKAALKKEFAALKVKVAEMLKQKQMAVEEKAQQAQAHSAETGPAAAATAVAGRGRGGARGGMRAPIQTRIDNRPKSLEINELHQDLRWEGLLRSHFQTFGLVKAITFMEDDPATWCFFFSRLALSRQSLSWSSSPPLCVVV